MISHTTAQFGRHRHCGSGDKMFLFYLAGQHNESIE